MTAITAGAYAAWYVIGLDRWRARIPDVIDPIIFGGLTLLLGLLCLAAIPACGRRFLGLLLAIGAFAGLTASALSGTRGAWIALPIGLLLLDRYQWRWLGARWRWGSLSVVVVIVAALSAWPETRVADRIMDAYSAIERTFMAEQGETSGFWFRPTLYNTAIRDIIPEAPWLGHGPIDLRAKLQALADRPEASGALKRLAKRDEATQTHNDALQALVWGGVAGLVVLVSVYIIPFLAFRRVARARVDPVGRCLAVMGMLVPVLYAVLGLSYSFFAFPVSAAVYFLLTLFLAFAIRAESVADAIA